MKKQKKKGGTAMVPVAILALGAVALVGMMIYRVVVDSRAAQVAKAKTEQMEKESKAGCTHSPVKAAIAGLENVACTSANHVAEGRAVSYQSDPPMSGEHWPSWVAPGFFKTNQPKEKLVHSLEHGYIVIYYNEAKLSASELDAIKALAAKYQGAWDGVVAVPRNDARYPLILTAWEHGLRLERWDQARIDAFVDAFRGRGPENPVRPLQP